MRIETLTDSNDVAIAAAALSAAGAATGFMIYNKHTRVVSNTIYRDPGDAVSIEAYPTAAADHIVVAPIVTFASAEQYRATVALADLRSTAVWHMEFSRCAYANEITLNEDPAYDDPNNGTPAHVIPSSQVPQQTQPQPEETAASDDLESEHHDPPQAQDTQPQQPGDHAEDAIPKALRTSRDPIVAAIVRHYTTGIKPAMHEGLHNLDAWVIPDNLKDDSDALEWLQCHMESSTITKFHYNSETITKAKRRNINEQIKLNKTRAAVKLLENSIRDNLQTAIDDPGQQNYQSTTTQLALATPHTTDPPPIHQQTAAVLLPHSPKATPDLSAAQDGHAHDAAATPTRSLTPTARATRPYGPIRPDSSTTTPVLSVDDVPTLSMSTSL